MKKRNLKLLEFKKENVSNLNSKKINGGRIWFFTVSMTCPSNWYGCAHTTRA